MSVGNRRFRYNYFTYHKNLINMVPLSDVSDETSIREMASNRRYYYLTICKHMAVST